MHSRSREREDEDDEVLGVPARVDLAAGLGRGDRGRLRAVAPLRGCRQQGRRALEAGAGQATALYTAAISSYLASNPATPTVQLDAFVSGYSVAFRWAAGPILLAAPISFFMIKHSKADLVGASEEVDPHRTST